MSLFSTPFPPAREFISHKVVFYRDRHKGMSETSFEIRLWALYSMSFMTSCEVQVRI